MLKNIVIVSDAANVRGGAENVAVSTASMLAGRGYNVYYFAGTGQPDKQLMSSAKIKVINMNQPDILMTLTG